MKPQIGKGIGLLKTGLRAAKGGRKVLQWGGKLKVLPPLQRKAKAKAIKKEEKRLQSLERKELRQKQKRILYRNAKGAGRILLALRKRYF